MTDMRIDPRLSAKGFALVASLLLLTLIAMLAMGMTGLAAIELRRAAAGDATAQARANARLALMQAIGQLQRTLGPDQRVSASAGMLGETVAQPHWTGVWRSTRDDGSSFFERDDLAGGMRDIRWSEGRSSKDRVMEWLVSGGGDPVDGVVEDLVTLSSGENGVPVRAGRMPVEDSSGKPTGHLAWWTGDLGVRVNLGTHDPRDGPQAEAASTDEEDTWFRIMASQAADPSAIGEGVEFNGETRRLASAATTALTAAGREWARLHAFDFTVDSFGVIADTARGGLRRDLTAFFANEADVPSWRGLTGLSSATPLLGEPGDLENPDFRHRRASPNFGLLRDWARLALPFSGREVAARLPEFDDSAAEASDDHALANKQPVKLAGNTRAGLQPILVEATLFTHLSTLRLPDREPARFQLRHHHYPRVVLWNPYNVELDFDRAMIMIQGNGRQEMWTDNVHLTASGIVYRRSQSQWLSFEGGRSTLFNASGRAIMDTEGYNDPYIGSYYFAIPATRFAPGECLVFSPARSAEYDCVSPYRPGSYNLNSNELSCEVAPDVSRSYYISGTEIGGGMSYLPVAFWFAPTPYWSQTGRNGVENQGDDIRAVLKHVGDRRVVDFEPDTPASPNPNHFDRLPQLAVVSTSLQYGAGREPRISWSVAEKMPMELLDHANPRPTVIPNVRTREGVRLRWFDEHPSNLLNSGRLTGSPHFEDALLGNWNPRASFAVRSPWENIAGSMPTSGSAGGPWFFGAYTRDLFDQAVSWDEQAPVMSGGRARGNPFGPPQEGNGRYVLFDVPRTGTGVISLGQFQHVKLSELVWHPSYAIGNSLADPRLGSGGFDGLERSAAVAGDSESAQVGGFHQNRIGWSPDAQRSDGRDEWAVVARAILSDLPEDDNLVYDLSFESNHALWDRYFLSSGSPADKAAFFDDPDANPLPNGRMRLAPWNRGDTSLAALDDYHQAAAHLMIDGAFNVNSTRVEAWKALFASSRLADYAEGSNIPFPRVLDSPLGAWKNGDVTDERVWAGRRELTPEEIERLATAIVAEVKRRGPFISLADFVNRRLAADETGRMGALQAAIANAGLNSSLTAAYPLDNQTPLPDYRHPDHISDPTAMEQTLKPDSKAWGAPGWLTQADVLQVIGPALAARSDSFVIRAYGDAVDASGNITARAWCEAVIQRTPEPLDPDESGINPRLAGSDGDFGRRFVVTAFRWLSPAEI